MSKELWRGLEPTFEEISRAAELMEKRAHMPGIDAKEIMLRALDIQQLSMLQTQVIVMERLISDEEIELMRSEDLRELSRKDIRHWREQIERHKVDALKRAEEINRKVQKIVADAKLEKP